MVTAHHLGFSPVSGSTGPCLRTDPDSLGVRDISLIGWDSTWENLVDESSTVRFRRITTTILQFSYEKHCFHHFSHIQPSYSSWITTSIIFITVFLRFFVIDHWGWFFSGRSVESEGPRQVAPKRASFGQRFLGRGAERFLFGSSIGWVNYQVVHLKPLSLHLNNKFFIFSGNFQMFFSGTRWR